jgi:PEGA domain
MRPNAIALVIVAAVLGTTPAVAGPWHRHGSFRLGVGIGVGPLWWGPAWGPGWGVGWGPAGWYEPAAPVPARTDLTAVDTDVTPEHARVILDGELIGVADDFNGGNGYLYLKPGRYTLEFSLQGYRSVTMTVDSNPGRYVPIKLELQRVPGEKAAPWWDRPKDLPVSRVFGPPLPSPPPGAPAAAPDPNLRPALRAQAERPAPLVSANGGALELRVTPPNAAVYVDGALVGTGEELGRLERGLAVAAGPHTVEVVAPGLASRSVRVEVAEGQRQQVVVELERGAGQS